MKTKTVKKFIASVACVMAMSAGITTSRATLLVYEGFNGYSSGSLVGQNVVNTTGLTGTYASVSGAVNYDSMGLVFGNLSVSGGSASLTGSTIGAIGVGISSGVSATGTLYSSYLVKLGVTPTSATSAYTRINTTANTSGTTAYFNAMADAGNTSDGGKSGLGYTYGSQSAASSVASTALTAGDTFMVLAQYNNVGAASSPGTPGSATLWILSLSQFNYFEANGGLNVATFNSAGTGSADGQVYTRFTAPDATDYNTYKFDSTRALQLVLQSTASGTYTLDELRYGTNLTDVIVTVPEPSTVMSLVLGGLLLGAMNRRKRMA